MKKENYDSLAIARRICAAGRPIHIAEDEGVPASLPAGSLIVRQTGGMMESFAIEAQGGTSFIISLAITSKIPRFAIARFGLELPWTPDYFYWIEDPFQVDGTLRPYRVPNEKGLDFERSRVLNHQADITRTLSRGHSREGFLIGYAFEPVPEDFRTGMMLPAFVIIYDQFGAMLQTGVELHLVRRPKPASQPKTSLLDHPDPVPMVGSERRRFAMALC